MSKRALFCILLALQGCASHQPTLPPQGSCQASLDHSRAIEQACKDVVKAQDKQLSALKHDVKDLTTRLNDQRPPQFLDILPNWAWLFLGTAFGLYIGTQLHR